MKYNGNSWSLKYEEGIVVGQFEKRMPASAFEEEVYEAFEELCQEHRTDIVGTVDVIEIEKSLGETVPKFWHQTTRQATNLPNYERAAVISDGLDIIYLDTELRELNIEIQGFDEDLNRAIGWARGDAMW